MKREDFLLVAALVIAGLRFLPFGGFSPAGELRVLVVREAKDTGKIGDDQALIYLGNQVRDKVERLGGKFRVVDDDQVEIPAEWQPLFVGDPAMVPRMAVARGNNIKVRPLPKNVEAAIAVIE